MNNPKTKNFNSEVRYDSFENIKNLKNKLNCYKFKPGQIIFYEGHLPYGLFFLSSGEVKLTYGNLVHENICSKAFIGISAFINKTTYSGTAETITECKIYFLSNFSSKDIFEKINLK